MHWLLKTAVSSAVNAAITEGVKAIARPRETPSQKPPLSLRYSPRYYNFTFNTNATTSNENKKDLNNCLSFFEEGIEMLQMSLDRISCSTSTDVGDERAERTQRAKGSHVVTGKTDVLASMNREIFAADVGKLKSITQQSFSWAQSSFKAARDDATRAFNNRKLSIDDRLLAAKVRIFSAILGCLDEPEMGAIACKVYLEELNHLPNISKEFSDHLRKINKSFHEKSSVLLSNVSLVNYFVFNFTETLSVDALNVENWPRLKAPENLYVHPIRSIGLRTLTMGIDYSEYDLHPKSISFSEAIDAADVAVNSVGEFIIAGLDCTASKEPVVKVYSKFGEYRFAISPTKEHLKEGGRGPSCGIHPRAVFTDERDNIYVYTKPGHGRQTDENATLFIFNKEGSLQRVVSIEHGFMALEKKSGKIFVSNKKGVFVYQNSGQLLHSFATPVPLQGSESPIALCPCENTTLLILADLFEANVYVLTDTGTEIRQFQVKNGKGWKYIEFNPISGEIVVSYLAKELTHFELESYLMNGQLLGRIHLPDQYPSHPRALTVTPSGRLAILYENIVHLI